MKKISKTMLNSGKMPRIVFFGNERIATGVTTVCPTLQKLIDAGYDIAAVVVNHDEKASRTTRVLEIADLAAGHEIPVYSPDKPLDISDKLRSLEADLGVLVAYGRIVPQSMIDIFPSGIVNIHPSLLPLHRGSTPIESAILGGEERTGVSLMKLSSQMDAGDVYAYSELVLTGEESKQHLADELLEIGSEMLLAVVPRLLEGDILGRPQDHDHATYDQLIRKSDGTMDLSKTATQLAREVRAYFGWPGSKMVIAGKDAVVTAAHVAEEEIINVDKKSTFIANKQLCLQAAEGILVIDELRPAGKGTMTASAFLAGYGKHI